MVDTKLVTMTGAVPGDLVLVSHTGIGDPGLILSGVALGDNVWVTLFNASGGVLDVASGTLRVTVIKP